MPVEAYLAKTELRYITTKSSGKNYHRAIFCDFLVPFVVGLDCVIET